MTDSLMIHHSEGSTQQCVPTGQITSNFLVYNLQLPQGRPGHHSQHGHHSCHDHHSRHDHHGCHGHGSHGGHGDNRGHGGHCGHGGHGGHGQFQFQL